MLLDKYSKNAPVPVSSNGTAFSQEDKGKNKKKKEEGNNGKKKGQRFVGAKTLQL
jgi:hypothetical protein